MTIEICVDCLASVEACTEAGADRIELCSGLVEGGTTPSLGFLRASRRIFPGKIMMMIRPRGGDFLYSRGEVEIMLEDIRSARAEGADGVVFGCLRADGAIDESLTSELMTASESMDQTFHRAFDVSRDLTESLDTLIRLEMPRVLTSGGRPSIDDQALAKIATLVKHAAGHIAILPGGGITADSVARTAAVTEVTECHLSARESIASSMNFRREDIPMGAPVVPGEYERKVASAALIRRARGL
jgi:copper homeostasis protein